MIDIIYNRSEKQYQWTDEESGEVLTAPAGAKNKAELFRAAVGMLQPVLYGAACNVISYEPYLERIVWKAVEIIINGMIHVPDNPTAGVLAQVQSSDQYGRYTVRTIDGYCTCECEFWQTSMLLTLSGQRMCKHIMAHHLYLVAIADF